MATHRLTPRFEDVATRDFPVAVAAQLILAEADTDADRLALAAAVEADGSVQEHLTPRLLPALVAAARGHDAADLLADPTPLAEALRAALTRAAFAAGLEVEACDVLRVASPAAEQAARLRAADAALAGLADRRAAGEPADVALAAALAAVPAGEREGVMLRALATTAEDRGTLWAVAGGTLTRIDCTDALHVHPPATLPDDLGPARSVTGVGGDLVVGCRDGLWRLPGGDLADAAAYRHDVGSDRGYRRAGLIGGKLAGEHSAAGTVVWDTPGDARPAAETLPPPALAWLGSALPLADVVAAMGAAGAEVAAGASHVAAVSADRRDVTVWRLGRREPVGTEPLMSRTRHRVGGVAFL